MALGAAVLAAGCVIVGQSRRHEALEQGVRLFRLRLKLGVKLHRDKPWMLGNFDDLDQAAHSLNNRPRQTLDWMSPSEKLAEVLQLSPPGEY